MSQQQQQQQQQQQRPASTSPARSTMLQLPTASNEQRQATKQLRSASLCQLLQVPQVLPSVVARIRSKQATKNINNNNNEDDDDGDDDEYYEDEYFEDEDDEDDALDAAHLTRLLAVDDAQLQKANRSASVDITLPARPGGNYNVVLAHNCCSAGSHARDDAKRRKGGVNYFDCEHDVEFEDDVEIEDDDDDDLFAVRAVTRLFFALTTIRSTTTTTTTATQTNSNKKKIIEGDVRAVSINGETRLLKSYVDWSADCTSNEHVWISAGSISDTCYVGEQECSRFGPSFHCAACKITIHSGCVGILTEKIKFLCKQTYKDLTVTNQRHLKEAQQQTIIFHHWVHKKSLNGRCKHCTKTFTNSMVPFSSKEVQAITCSWCKVSYHNKESCFTLSALTEQCTLGLHRESIVPPTWIVKVQATNKLHQQESQQNVTKHKLNDKSNQENDNNYTIKFYNNDDFCNNTMMTQDIKRGNENMTQKTQSSHQVIISQIPPEIKIHSHKDTSLDDNNCLQVEEESARYNDNTCKTQTQRLTTSSDNIIFTCNNNNNDGNADSIMRSILDSKHSNLITSSSNNNSNTNSTLSINDNEISSQTVSDTSSEINEMVVECNNKSTTVCNAKKGFNNNDKTKLSKRDADANTTNFNNIETDFNDTQISGALISKNLNEESLLKYTNNKYQNQQTTTPPTTTLQTLDAKKLELQQLNSIKNSKQQSFDNNKPDNNGKQDFNKYFKTIPISMPGIPEVGSKPVLVFVNPKSGGSQGAKMMQKFTWLLNPRQVCDLTRQGGPKSALKVFQNLKNLTIITVGGDGTASWILSSLDELGIANKIPVAVLPLGTGNDLARALGWGGYSTDPAAKILAQVRDGHIVMLDRWNIHVERNYACEPISLNESSNGSATCYDVSNESSTANQKATNSHSISPSSSSSATSNFVSIIDSGCELSSNSEILSKSPTSIAKTPTTLQSITTSTTTTTANTKPEKVSSQLPMNVINNYFSLGVDAYIALQFHLARLADPTRFGSRVRNRMYYGQVGGKDLLQRKWKDLSNFVTLECDGQDLTPRLKELKVHSVLFLNIPSYGGGTKPWSTANNTFEKPKTDDGLIEVIGLTTFQLPLLQAGGHGKCLAQCKNAKIVTSRTIPMQVDGEPCKLLPSIISITFRNRVCMLAKSK